MYLPKHHRNWWINHFFILFKQVVLLMAIMCIILLVGHHPTTVCIGVVTVKLLLVICYESAAYNKWRCCYMLLFKWVRSTLNIVSYTTSIAAFSMLTHTLVMYKWYNGITVAALSQPQPRLLLRDCLGNMATGSLCSSTSLCSFSSDCSTPSLSGDRCADCMRIPSTA